MKTKTTLLPIEPQLLPSVPNLRTTPNSQVFRPMICQWYTTIDGKLQCRWIVEA